MNRIISRCSLVTLMLACGCSEPDNSSWALAAADSYSDDPRETYNVAWLDEAGSRCVRMRLARPGAGSGEPSGVDVRGLPLDIAAISVTENVVGCTPQFIDGGSYYSLRGKLELENFNEDWEPRMPCTLSFDIEIRPDLPPDSNAAFEWNLIELAATDVPILSEGCPRPVTGTTSITELSAAYGVVNEVGNLVVAGWDPDLEVCAIARMLDSTALDSVPSTAVEAPGPWAYTGLRIALTERDECVANNFVLAPVNPTYKSQSAPVLDSTGEVGAASGTDALPCELDVDLDLQTYGGYFWNPDDVAMRDTAVVVSGACE